MATDKVREHSTKALAAIDASLAEENTARHFVDELKREMREKLPSAPEINVTVALPPHSRHHSSSPPSAPSLDAHIPLLGHWKAKGLKAIVAVLVVAALVVLAVAAVKSAAVGREVPAGHSKD